MEQMNLCPQCREALSEFYDMWPDETAPQEMRRCGQCVFQREYYGAPYLIRSRRAHRARAKTFTNHRSRAGESKRDRWREQFEND